MKRLTLIRHAKSSWNYPELSDFERPLNGRGRRDAPAMALRALEAVGLPDLWLSSPASRAITTARIFADALALPTDVLLDARIYDADVDRLMEVVKTLPAQSEHAWLFGHNPGFTEFSQWLSREAPAHMPTCSVVGHRLDIEHWASLTPGCGALACFVYPKQLRA